MNILRAGYCAVLTLTLGITANAGLINGSFETPVQAAGGFTYDPAGSGWTFTASSGIGAVGSPLFTNPAPDGTQAAFLQANGTSGSFSQSVTGLTIGTVYDFSFYEAAMPGITADPITVTFGLANLGTFINNSTAWEEFTSGPTAATATSMTLTFASQNTTQNILSNIDDITLQDPVAPEPASLFLLLPGLGVLLFQYRRRKSAV